MVRRSVLRLIILLALITLMVGALFAMQNDLIAFASINYVSEITISNDGENGYLYGNGGTFNKADTLQQVFDDLLSQEIASNAIVNFDNVVTSDKVVLSGKRKVVIGGEANYSGTSADTFITINDGDLAIIGAHLSSATSNLVRVNEGAEMSMESGSLTIDGALDNKYITATLINNGSVKIVGGVILFNATGAENAGSAIAQAGANSQLVIEENVGSSVEIKGNNALNIEGGSVSINGGEYVATADKGATNGNAMLVINDAKITLSNGTFSSVTPNKTIELRGGNDSTFSFNGGNILGKIRFGKRESNEGTNLFVGGRTIQPCINGYVSLFSNGESLTTENAKLEVETIEGYYCLGWLNLEDLTPSLTMFESDAIITPTLSNIYTITFEINGNKVEKEVSYGTSVNPTYEELGVSLGYEITWENEIGESEQAPFKVLSDVKYVGTLNLLEPTINDIEDLELVYSGENHLINVDLVSYEGLNYSYEWQKKETDWQTIATGASLSVERVADSGQYRLKVIVDDGTLSNESFSNEFSVNVIKGEYQSVVHKAFSGQYNNDKRLSDYILEEYFSWENEDEVPSVTKKEYKAFYCDDVANYNAKEVWITVDLVKADAVEGTHPTIANSYVYDPAKTLKDYPFTHSTWRWSDESQVPQAGGSNNYYGAYYNPDRDNYEDYYTQVALVIGKASYSSIPDVCVTIEYKSGLTGEYVDEYFRSTLGYYKVAPTSLDDKLNAVREFVLDGVYNEDTKNYNDYTDCKIRVTVTKGSNSVDYNSDNTIYGGEYSPEKTLSDITLYPNWRWENPSEVPTVNKRNYVIIFNLDVNLYEDFYLDVTLIIDKATLTNESHSPLSGTYSPTQKLEDFTLENGWSFVTGNDVPTVDVTNYPAILDKGENYNIFSGYITLNLSKATYDTSTFSFADKIVTYDGNAHSISISGTLPQGVSVVYYNNDKVNAGRHVVEVSFIIGDSTNYNLIQPQQAVLSILKATPSIIVEESYHYAYNGNIRLPSATINNAVQTLKVEYDVEPREIGEYEVKFVALENTNYNSVEKTIKVIINPNKISINGVYSENVTSFIGSVVNQEVGIDTNSNLSMEITSLTNDETSFKILLNDEAKPGNYKVQILLPDGMNNDVAEVYYLGNEKQALEFVVSGNYLIFETTALGNFVIVAGEPWTMVEESGIEWWGWLLISIAIAITIALSSVGVIIAYKKGKLPVEKIKNLIKLKQKTKEDKSGDIDEEK